MNTNLERAIAESGVAADGFSIGAAVRLLRRPLALRAMRALVPHAPSVPVPERPAAAFAFDLVRRVYAEHPERVVWTSICLPSELIWGLGLTPFLPEVAAVVAAGLGLGARSLAEAAAGGCPPDLCTVHRGAFGLEREGLMPPAAAYVATSHLCSVAGMMLAAEAWRQHKPFVLIDVPGSADADAVDYVERQLEALIPRLEEATGARFDPDRLRVAIRRSNEARALAVEFHALRAARPAPIRGGQALGTVGLMAWLLGHPDGAAHFRAWRDYAAGRIARHDPEQPAQKVRLLWLHVGPHSGNTIVPHLEDHLGAVIAFEEHSHIWWEPLDEAHPLRALAARLVTQPQEGPIGRRLELVLDLVARYGCDGVVHFSHWGCRQTSGALSVLRDGLRREGIPLLDLDGDCLDPTNTPAGPLRTRIDAFVETLT